MKLFSRDTLKNPRRLFLIITLSLSFFVIVILIGFFVWNKLSTEGQEEFEHAATIYYYKSNKCAPDCSLYGRSVNTRKPNRHFLIDAITLGKLGGSSIIDGEIIDPSSWKCTRESKLVNSSTEPLREGQHYNCFKVYSNSTE